MSEFLDDFLAGEEIIAREVEYGGKKGTVHFRRISAGQQAQLSRGQTIAVSGNRKGKKGKDDDAPNTMQMDMGVLVESQLKLVQFSVCRADGALYFRDVEAVKKAPKAKISALYKVAQEINEDEGDDPEKS